MNNLQPLSPVQEISDLNRRYAAIKERFIEIAKMENSLGVAVATPGITISSRLKLRCMVISEHGPIAELSIGAGEANVREQWLVGDQLVG